MAKRIKVSYHTSKRDAIKGAKKESKIEGDDRFTRRERLQTTKKQFKK